jgi:hypothetical protein
MKTILKIQINLIRNTLNFVSVEFSAFYTPNPLSRIFKNIILNKYLVTR